MYRHFLLKKSIEELPPDIQKYIESFFYIEPSTRAFSLMRLKKGWSRVHQQLLQKSFHDVCDVCGGVFAHNHQWVATCFFYCLCDSFF